MNKMQLYLCATLSLLLLNSVANADLVLHVDEASSTATLTGSATADEHQIAFQGWGIQFGGPGASSSSAGVFGTESDDVNHDRIVLLSGGGIAFTGGADTTSSPNTTLTGSGVAVNIGNQGFLGDLLARDGDVYTALLNSTDTLTVSVSYAVPEPAGAALLGLGLVVCSVKRRRR